MSQIFRGASTDLFLPGGIVGSYIPSKAFEGYTLFAPLATQNVWLVDMVGRFIHRWKVDYRPGEYGKLLPNGNLLFGGKLVPEGSETKGFGGQGGVIQEMDWDGEVLWRYEDPNLHHDFSRLENGNTMVLRYTEVPKDLAMQVQGGEPGTEQNGKMFADAFQEITPEGDVVWEWNAYEHLDPAIDVVCPFCMRNEWTHTNTCHVMPDGDILTAFHRLHTVAIIDRKTGRIKWRYGADGELAHPHDPSLLENGNILIFDNGLHRKLSKSTYKPNYTRVVELNPESGKVEWEYIGKAPDKFYSSLISGCQRLPNGNTLICEGINGRIFEVTMEGEVVWEFISPFFAQLGALGYTSSIFRAYRYSPDWEGFKGKSFGNERFGWSIQDKKLSDFVEVCPESEAK